MFTDFDASPLSIPSPLYQGNTLSLTIAIYSLVEFLTTHIMTSHLSVLAPRKDSKNPDLYYYPTTRHIWIN